MKSYELFILSLFDGLMIILIMLKLVPTIKISKRKIILFILMGSILISINNIIINQDILNHILSSVINVVLLRFIITRKIKKTSDYILIFILTFGFLVIIQMASIIIIKGIFANFIYNFIYGLLSQVLGTIIVILVRTYIPIERLKIFLDQENIVFKILVINLYIVYFSITTLWFIGVNHLLNSPIRIVLIIMLALVINTIFLRTSLVSKADKEKVEVLETYLPIIDDIMEELRAKQHDYHNHIQSLEIMKDNKMVFTDEIYERYMEQIATQEVWSYLIKLDNKILMAFFYSKYKYAQEEGLDIHFNISNYFINSHYTDYQLVEMYGILIDNAIEAAVLTPDKYMKISLELIGEKNLLRVTNSSNMISPVNISKMFVRGYSTKTESNRGLGLYKLKNMIEKEKGRITAYYNEKEKRLVIEVLHS